MSDDERRNQMVDGLLQREQLRPETEAAMRTVPRHEFVPESRQGGAYRDTPLPIGEGQTISAPHMVAIMTDRLELSPGETVLEIGTGCGYHAAVTAAVVGAENVYSVEYHEELAADARETLDAVGYGDISVRVGDGRNGWAAHAPYDCAYLTCAASEFPESVIEQVRPGGILLGPIGDGTQVLVKAVKDEHGNLDREQHGHVRFVPLM